MCVLLSHFSSLWLSCDPVDRSRQASQFMGFSGQEYWSGLPMPSSGGSSWPREGTPGLLHYRQMLYHWATGETLPGCLCPRVFPGKNTRVGNHSLPPGDLPDSGIEPWFAALQADYLTVWATRKLFLNSKTISISSLLTMNLATPMFHIGMIIFSSLLGKELIWV